MVSALASNSCAICSTSSAVIEAPRLSRSRIARAKKPRSPFCVSGWLRPSTTPSSLIFDNVHGSLRLPDFHHRPSSEQRRGRDQSGRDNATPHATNRRWPEIRACDKRNPRAGGLGGSSSQRVPVDQVRRYANLAGTTLIRTDATLFRSSRRSLLGVAPLVPLLSILDQTQQVLAGACIVVL
jgi:hypothetical protein